MFKKLFPIFIMLILVVGLALPVSAENGVIYDGPTMREATSYMAMLGYRNVATDEKVFEHPAFASVVFNGNAAILTYSVEGKEFIWEMEIISYTNDTEYQTALYELSVISINGVSPLADVIIPYAAYYGEVPLDYLTYPYSTHPYHRPYFYIPIGTHMTGLVILDGITYELHIEFGFLDEEVIWNEESADPITVSTMFTGEVVSNTGQYDLAIAGHFTGELLPGENVLTLAEIQANTISIVAHNNNTGTNRVMTQTTIEEMTVTVSGGRITSIYIVGRVQTPDGTLDRYSLTIPL